MPLALFTTLALAMLCPCELAGLNDSLHPSVNSDWLQSPEPLAEGGAHNAVELNTVMQPVGADVRSHHLSLRGLPPRDSLNEHADSAYVRSAEDPEWRTEKIQKVPSPNLPVVLRPLAPSEKLIGGALAVAAETNTGGWLEETKAEAVGGVLLVDAVPVDTVPADALGTDDLEIGVEAVIPPPVSIEEIQADLLEVLGLDSQVPEAPKLQPREVPPWAATIYGGRFTSDDLGPALIGDLSGFEDSALVGFGLARTLAGRRPLTLEAEAQILQHFGNQGHSEGTVALVLRWHDFPWDDKIDTTFAIGEGLSFATSVPELEILRNGRSTQLLNYLLFELTFALPQEPDWQFVGRLHHRSGVYGLFDGVGSGSNIYSAGIRRRF